MDPITHALAGSLIASFSKNQLSVTDPILLAAVIGSIAPDLDIIYQLKGDMAYLKKHRGFSHSFFGITAMSAGIGKILSIIFPGTVFMTLFFWSLLGTLSHVFLDYLNSYGAQLLWPFVKKKYNLGLLTVFDPVLVFLMLSTFIGQLFYPLLLEIGSICIVVYFCFRLYMRHQAASKVKRNFPNATKIFVIPSVVSIWNWHFLLECEKKITVGELKFLSLAMKIRRSFRKQKNHPAIQAALNSSLGKLFQDFTPIFHVACKSENKRHLVKFIDLRYFIRNDFMHHAYGIVNDNYQMTEGIFQPYSKNRKIKVAE